MALFIGWTAEEMRTALARANEHFGGNLCFDYLAPQNSKDNRYRVRVVVHNASRLKKRDLVNYPETLKKYEDAGELLPDFLYPYGCGVNWDYTVWGGKSCPRGIASACWHANGQFYRELFRINPNGKIRTAIANYTGEEGFNKNFWGTENRNVGSQIHHISMADKCCCDIHGIGEDWQSG